MTKAEFLAGYSLLTVQPWGKLYRGSTPEATIQAELYYRHVNQANPHVWQAVCEVNASGDHWPNLGELKEALKLKGGWEKEGQRQLGHQPEIVECPPEVREKLAKIGVNL